MGSSSSPPVLYLTDDDDDNEVEQHMPYGHSLSGMMNENLPRKKRKLTNANVRINPSIVNWSKRQRNDHYYRSHQIPQNLTNHEREVIVLNSNEYNLEEQESHSFHAFDWSSDARTSTRIHQHPIQTLPRVSIIPRPLPLPPPSNVVNVVKHHLNHSDSVPLMPMSRQNDRYMQQSQRKLINVPKCTTPPQQPLPLPLPTQTSSIIRPTAQRVQPGKNLRNPYSHSTSSPLLPVRQSIEPIFPRTFQSSCSAAPIITPTATPEIRRQALNGTGILSAFYDSKCYRCNICKFKSITSSTLLQHLFTHIFFCHHCTFFTYSHHNLYQHIFEKHNYNLSNDNIDPKMLELLYLTRCPDGTFALCMDSSPPKPPTPPPPPPKPDEQPIIPPPAMINKKPTKPKTPRKKKTKQKKEEDNDIVLIEEKRDIDLQPSSSTSTIAKHPIIKEKQPNTYVLMKHRRCYAVKYPPCLHSLSVEYSICREHTIRHMCHTQNIFKRRKFKPNSNIIRLIDEAANCLKTIVNDVVDMEEKSDSSDLLFALPNTMLNLIFPTEDLNILTSSLKLCNKYDKAIEQQDQNISEEPVRTSNQHIFILSATGVNKYEQSIFASLTSSITSADTVFTQTKLKKLPVAYDNTHRFFKTPLSTTQQPTTSNAKLSNKNSISQPTNPEPIQVTVPKSSRYMNHSSSPTVDRNNNSVTSSAPSVIVLD